MNDRFIDASGPDAGQVQTPLSWKEENVVTVMVTPCCSDRIDKTPAGWARNASEMRASVLRTTAAEP